MQIRQRDLDMKAFVRGYCVSTVSLAVEHHGGMWYETYIFPAKDGKTTDWGEVWGVRYRTQDEAEKGHAETVAALETRELLGYDDEPL